MDPFNFSLPDPDPFQKTDPDSAYQKLAKVKNIIQKHDYFFPLIFEEEKTAIIFFFVWINIFNIFG